MPVGDFNPVPKPRYKRHRKTANQRGQVTEDVYATAWERTGHRCERRWHGNFEALLLVTRYVEEIWEINPRGRGLWLKEEWSAR